MQNKGIGNLWSGRLARGIARIGVLAAAATLSVGAGENWITNIAQTERGHQIGNQDARLKLTEFVSYTCGHCGEFTRTGEGPLQLLFVGQGTVALEIRPVIRNGFDITLTMLAQCGDPAKFPQNHAMIMHRQKEWLPKATNATPAQRQRWSSPDRAAGRRALTSDLGFYELMEQRGYRRTDVDTCLNDEAVVRKLMENSRADMIEFGHTGTPSFALNGKLLPGVHNWDALSKVLTERLSDGTPETDG